MSTATEPRLARLRTRWSAVGAAVAITLGGGGFGLAQAAVGSGDKPITVTVDAERVLDTRVNLGLAGGFASSTPRDLQITGSVDVARPNNTTAKKTVVPAGATAALVNVTVVTPTSPGFLTLRAKGAVGAPTTSTVNFTTGSIEPNAATVDLSSDGKIQVWVKMGSATGTADVLVDIVGYTFDHNHDDRYYTEGEVDGAVAAAVAPKANTADVYTKTQVDAAVAPKANSADVYTKSQVDAAIAPKANSADVYTQDQVDALIPPEGGVAFNGGGGNADIPVDTWVLLAQVAAVVPVDGSVVMNGSVNILTAVSGDSQAVRCRLRIDGVAQTDKVLQVLGASGYFTHSETFGREVTAGSHFFGIECRREGVAVSPVGAFSPFISVVFSPNNLRVLL